MSAWSASHTECLGGSGSSSLSSSSVALVSVLGASLLDVRPLGGPHPVDRCKAEGVSEGFVKMHLKAGTDEILGATIVSPHAGDMISEITTCIQYGIGAAKLAGVMHPYPTQQEAVRQCAARHTDVGTWAWCRCF